MEPELKRKKHLVKATVFDKKGRVLSVATNSYSKSHPLQAKFARMVGEPYKIFLHAELLALIRCTGEPHTLRVERYGVGGEMRLARPCPICSLAIEWYGVERVEYTTDSGEWSEYSVSQSGLFA